MLRWIYNGLSSGAPKGRFIRRILLKRRTIDPVLLSAALACFPVKLGLETVLLGFFIVSGTYLILCRHRTVRLIDPWYATASLSYAAVAVVIGLYHGDFAANIRWIGLPTYFALGIPLFTGFVLIRNPLRQMVIGARVGLLLTLGMALFESFAGQSRIGLGGNAANAAFVICVMAVLARFSVPKPPRYIPNSHAWFYFAIIPVLMTRTRSVLPIFGLAAFFDLVKYRSELFAKVKRLGPSRLAVSCLAALMVIGFIAYGTSGIITRRIQYTVLEFDNLSASAHPKITGLDIRINLWKGAIQIVRDHPLVGVGGRESMRQIKEGIPLAQRKLYRGFVHVHFFALDEMRDRGLIGLFFLLGLFLVIFRHIVKTSDYETRVNILIFACLLLLYGSLHGLLLGDRNIAAIILMFTGVISTQRRGKRLSQTPK